MAEEEKDLLTQDQVFDVIRFAENLNGFNGMYSNYLNPMMVNQQLKNVNLSPLAVSEDTLAQAMQDPKNSEIQLQGFSQEFEITSQVYSRLLSYLGDMLSFDLTYTCINAEYDDYKKSAKKSQYDKDLDEVKKFIDSFDYRKEFGTVVREMLRNEAYFACVRFDDKNNIVLQELPASPNYTMITGRSPYGLLFSMNFYWFLQPGVDINMYPDFFKQKYMELWGDKKGNIPMYDPSLSPSARGASSWVYWQDIPLGVNPYGWCFKFHPESVSRLPYFTGLFNDLVQQPLIRALQKNINMSVAARIISGEVPMLKETASKVKDMISISPETLGKFLALVKAAIGDALKTVAMPLSNIKTLGFASENDVYPAYLRNALASSGINTNLIFTQTNRVNALESQLSIGIDEQLMLKVYPQFEAFMNYHINRMTKKFKFKIKFEGTNNFTNRQQRYDKATGLANLGMILPHQIGASLGLNPFEFERQLSEAQSSGFADRLKPLILASQMPGELAGGKGSAGRPQKSDSNLSDSGENTRGDGGNLEKGGSV